MLQFLNKSKFHTNCAFPIDCNHLSSILDFPPYHTPARDVYSISLCPPTKASQPQSGVSHAGANIVFQQPLGGVSCRLCNVFVFRQFRHAHRRHAALPNAQPFAGPAQRQIHFSDGKTVVVFSQRF